jgi:hypothetical protein
MSQRHRLFLHLLADGEQDEEERQYVLAELYGSGMFDASLSWSVEGQPVPNVPGLPVTGTFHHEADGGEPADAPREGGDAEEPLPCNPSLRRIA